MKRYRVLEIHTIPIPVHHKVSYNSLSGAARCFGDDEYMSMAISGSETSSGKGLSCFDIPMLDCDDAERQDVEQNKVVDLANCAVSSRSGSSCLERNQMSESHKQNRK